MNWIRPGIELAISVCGNYCRHGYSNQLIMVDFSEPCLVLRDLLCRRYGSA